MLTVLFFLCSSMAILFGIIIIRFLFDNKGTRKRIDKEFKIVISLFIVCLILIFPLRMVEKKITESIETKVSTLELSKDNFYMITSMEQNGENLFICEDKEGNLHYLWATLEETKDSSEPYVEKTQFLLTTAERFWTATKTETYVIYSSPKHINYITKLIDVPFEELS